MTDELMVRVVGGLAVRGSDRPVLRGAELGSRKARTLLAMLAVCPGYVPADRITVALWDETPPRCPAANIATLISRLRGVLGAASVDKCDAGHRLALRVDLRVAASLVAGAESLAMADRTAAALTMARRATHLLDHGEVFAEEPDAPWAEPARAWHRVLLRRARHTIAEAALCVGDIQAARTAAETAADDDAFDEAAWRMLMVAHRAAGEPARALLTYQRLRTVLATELGVDPDRSTQDLHVAILRDSSRGGVEWRRAGS